ncbi:hypothetical protein FQN60_002868 [Etheostoma spectabile]|uniref:Uncharacterized protein n=1 Tax=Etheostoma spectabile TaxID=54343 RepID=A0A5J5CHT7_9PERO|nr:hypothetical protein FQN60_002868 [Etheostoma spectabile]
MVMGLWNFLLLGSTVTMGLKVARLPRIFFTVSSGTGWAWDRRDQEGSLNQRDAPAAQSPALWSHLISLLPDSRHNSKVLWEVLGDDAADSLLLQLLRTVQFCRDGKDRNDNQSHLTEAIALIVVQMLLPAFSVLAAQQDQLSLLAPHRAKMRNLHYHGPGKELSSCRADLNQSAGQAFSFHHGRRRRQFVSLDQSTGDPGGRCALSGGDDDAHAVVTTSSHGAAPGVDHEADQEPDREQKRGRKREERRKRQRVIGDTERERVKPSISVYNQEQTTREGEEEQLQVQ